MGAAEINHHFQNGETTCRQLYKRLPDNSTIFSAEATAITLVLDYYWHMDPVQHDVVFLDSMFCLQVMEGKENRLICYTVKLPCALIDKSFSAGCQVIVALKVMIVSQLEKETLDHE